MQPARELTVRELELGRRAPSVRPKGGQQISSTLLLPRSLPLPPLLLATFFATCAPTVLPKQVSLVCLGRGEGKRERERERASGRAGEKL